MDKSQKDYSYVDAGFSTFLTRSIDDTAAVTLGDMSTQALSTNREINYDQSQTTGSLGSSTRIGNIDLDGVKGRITIFDENNREVVWIGNIGD